ncbi:Ppx/GppA phosphatase family protein [Chelativorans composti]
MAVRPKAALPDSGAEPVKRTRKRRRKRSRKRVFMRGGESCVQKAAPADQLKPRTGAPPAAAGGETPSGKARGDRQNLVRYSLNRPDERLYAALDLGTNNCRLLIAAPTRPGRFRVVDAFSRIVRLGEGLSSSGKLGEAAMERALAALAICAQKLEGKRFSGMQLIATEACRAASNGAQFLERVRKETGLRLTIIDRETEARLAVAGCSSLVGRDTDGLVLFDIGGGSSEIALVDLTKRRSGRLSDNIVAWTSLPVGVVSIAERFGGRDVSPESFEAMVEAVSELLRNFEGADRLKHVASSERFHLLGTSGTVTTLAGVHLGLRRYDRRRVDGLWLDRQHVDSMIRRILSWNFDQRKANPCIGEERADLVLAGCAILEAIRRQWPSERLRVADRGLREGMLSEMMARDGVWRRKRFHAAARIA